MKDLLDNIDFDLDDLYLQKLPTILPEAPLRTLEEEDFFQFKKRLFKNTRIFKAESLMEAEDDLFDPMYWSGEISTAKRYSNDLIVGKDGRRLQEYIIDCLIDYTNKGINPESTPAFIVYYVLNEEGYDFNDTEKEKIKQYEALHNTFTHMRSF